MKVVAAPDKFRGTATAAEVAAAVGVAATDRGRDFRAVPMSDGGEGLLEAFGGANRHTAVTGPRGRPVTAAWRLDGRHAVIESAQACGLAVAGGAACNDPETATTAGVGDLLVAAARAGATEVVVGLGGSATTDGGAGALAAVTRAGADAAVRALAITVCCDVDTPFTRAAEVFGPQKGADAAAVARLADRLRRQHARIEHEHGLRLDDLPGTGAAGGLAGGLAVLGGRLVPGSVLVADRVGLDDALQGAGLVVAGEGRLDATSLRGKVVGEVAARCRARGLPLLVVVGDRVDGLEVPGGTVVSLTERVGRDRALADPLPVVTAVVTEYLTVR